LAYQITDKHLIKIKDENRFSSGNIKNKNLEYAIS